MQSLLRGYWCSHGAWEMDGTLASNHSTNLWRHPEEGTGKLFSFPYGVLWYMCIWVLSEWVSFLFYFFIKRCVAHIFFLLLMANMQLSKFFRIMSRLENRVSWLILSTDKKDLRKISWICLPPLPGGSGCTHGALTASLRFPDMAKNQHVLIYDACFICIPLLPFVVQH